MSTQPLSTSIAQEISRKLSEQVSSLFNRNWPEIATILQEDGEIKLAFGTTVTNRDGEPGTHADKDHRLKVTLAFSVRHTDTIEVALEDPSQPELSFAESSFNAEVTTSTEPTQPEPERSEEGSEAETSWDNSRPYEALPLEEPAVTPFGQALQKAAAGKDLPIVPVKIDDGYTPERARNQFRKAARKMWPEAAVDLIDEALLACGDDLTAVMRILSAHTLTPSPDGAAA